MVSRQIPIFLLIILYGVASSMKYNCNDSCPCGEAVNINCTFHLPFQKIVLKLENNEQPLTQNVQTCIKWREGKINLTISKFTTSDKYVLNLFFMKLGFELQPITRSDFCKGNHETKVPTCEKKREEKESIVWISNKPDNKTYSVICNSGKNINSYWLNYTLTLTTELEEVICYNFSDLLKFCNSSEPSTDEQLNESNKENRKSDESQRNSNEPASSKNPITVFLVFLAVAFVAAAFVYLLKRRQMINNRARSLSEGHLIVPENIFPENFLPEVPEEQNTTELPLMRPKTT